ncbi:MAG: acetyl-CoA carboxylase, carboxyltransferase subunit beta [Elusimicrobiota bacterium]|jgi:acetyl-CoA carboxylase carboxyl transferase subunit beta
MPLEPSPRSKKPVPAGVWTKCDKCEQIIYNKELAENLKVCPKCGAHFRMSARERIAILFDEDSFKEFGEKIMPVDSLGFADIQPYAERLQQSQKKTGQTDACVAGEATIDGRPLVAALLDFDFMGGSMGSVVGEKVTLAIERALKARVPLLVVSASGGARMQESILSLMQMAKTSVALARLDAAGLPFISLLTDPTTGGVTASFAMLGDIILAEPKALIAFAGPRVIEQTIRQQLPNGFQLSEFLLDHGMIDVIVPRAQLKKFLGDLLAHFQTPTGAA